jgi:hypothetical protein
MTHLFRVRDFQTLHVQRTHGSLKSDPSENNNTHKHSELHTLGPAQTGPGARHAKKWYKLRVLGPSSCLTGSLHKIPLVQELQACLSAEMGRRNGKSLCLLPSELSHTAFITQTTQPWSALGCLATTQTPLPGRCTVHAGGIQDS